LATEWRANQLLRENDDLAFQVPEKQWTDDAAAKFKGGLINGIFSPPRAMLSISKIDQPVQLVLNQERQAHLGVQVHPLSEDADKETAERIQDLYRGIERDSFADLARTWAYERAVKAGMGYYRILTDYADDGGSIHDQKIVIKRILDQRCVLLDPFATEPDWSDGQKALIYEMVPFDRYKRQYPDSQLANFDALDFDGLNDEIGTGWSTGTDDARTVRIAEYFYVEFADDVQQEGDKPRTIQKPVVKWCKVNGVEVLEEAVIPGKYIPIIPVIGQELQPFDDERRFFGLISRAKDPQRLLNIEVSNAVNKDALSTKVPWLVAEGQEEGHEQEFEMSTVRNLSMIRYKPTTISGQPVPPPQRMLESPDLSSSLQLINQANDYIQATTFTYDPSLGKGGRSGKPARAILAEQQQSEQGNSNYLDNLARAMRHEARVVLGMIPTIYDRPGRRVRGVDGEDNEQEIIINAPFVPGPEGRPQPVEPGMPPQPGMPGPPGMAPGMPPTPPKKPKLYDLRKGVYGVSVNIGKSAKSRMEAGSDALGSLLQAQPNLMPILGPTWLNFQDFPGAKEAADLLKKMQPPQLQQGKDGEQSLEHVQAQNAQLQQMVEQAKQQIDQMQKALETKQIEQQGKIAAAQASDQSKAQIEQMKADMALREQAMQGQIDAMLIKLKGVIDLKLQDDAQAHEVAMASAGAQHEASERDAEQQHAVAMGGATHDFTAQEADRDHQRTMDAEERRASMQGDGAGE
jgi:Phage P22-like portal protein